MAAVAMAARSPSLSSLGDDDEEDEEAVLHGDGLEFWRWWGCRGRRGGGAVAAEAPVSEASDSLGSGGFRATSPLS